jgi:hypothetical protein
VKTLPDGSEAVTNRDGQRIKKGTTVKTISSKVDEVTGFMKYKVIDPATGETDFFFKEALDFPEKAARRSTGEVQAGPSTRGTSTMEDLAVDDSTTHREPTNDSTGWCSHCDCFGCFTKSASS